MYTVGQLTAALMTLIMLAPQAALGQLQKPAGADPVIQALQLKDRCAEQKDENPEAARTACEQGVRILSDFRSGDSDQTAAAGRLRGELDALLLDIRRRENQLDGATDTVRRHIKDRRLTTARSVFQQASFPASDARVGKLEQELKLSEAEVQRLVSEADALSKPQPKRSLGVYNRARQVNRELANPVNENEQYALEQVRQRPAGCHAACKITITMLVLGGIAAGGYYGYQVYKKEKNGQ